MEQILSRGLKHYPVLLIEASFENQKGIQSAEVKCNCYFSRMLNIPFAFFISLLKTETVFYFSAEIPTFLMTQITNYQRRCLELKAVLNH